MMIKHMADCLTMVVIWILSKRWKHVVGYMAGLIMINHFAIWSYFMTLAEEGKYGLTRIDALLTHELTFFLYQGYCLLLSPSYIWGITVLGPIYVIGSTIYDSTDFGYSETYQKTWLLVAGYRCMLVIASCCVYWIALERELTIFFNQ